MTNPSHRKQAEAPGEAVAGERSAGRVSMQNPFRREFRHDLRRELEDLYGFYVDEDRRARLGRMGAIGRTLHLVGWLLKSLLRRLSSWRRTLLLIGLICAGLGYFSVDLGAVHFAFNFYPVSVLILLFLLMLELKDKLVAREELRVGRAVQLALLPESSPGFPGWQIWLTSRPANDVGGDLTDFLRLSEGRLALALGDVAGKGLGAALLMAKLQATLRTIATEPLSLAELGARVNHIFCRDCTPSRFATLVYAEIEEGSGLVRVLNAGHPPPLVLHRDSVEELPPAALPIGVMETAVFAEQRIELAPGELLLLYSDGLTEATDREGNFFGEERLRSLLPRLRDLSAVQAGSTLLDAADRFIGDARVQDDLSLILLRRL